MNCWNSSMAEKYKAILTRQSCPFFEDLPSALVTYPVHISRRFTSFAFVDPIPAFVFLSGGKEQFSPSIQNLKAAQVFNDKGIGYLILIIHSIAIGSEGSG